MKPDRRWVAIAALWALRAFGLGGLASGIIAWLMWTEDDQET